MHDPLQLLSVQQVADLLGVPTSRIYDNWRAWGLKAIRVGQSLRFRRSDVEAWLHDHEESAA